MRLVFTYIRVISWVNATEKTPWNWTFGSTLGIPENTWNQALWLVYSSVSACDSDILVFMRSDRVTSRISVLLLILSVWFSLDHVSLCFWLNTTPTTTPSQVKTSLQSLSLGLAIVISLWKLDKFYVMQQNKQEINYKSIQPT